MFNKHLWLTLNEWKQGDILNYKYHLEFIKFLLIRDHQYDLYFPYAAWPFMIQHPKLPRMTSTVPDLPSICKPTQIWGEGT